MILVVPKQVKGTCSSLYRNYKHNILEEIDISVAVMLSYRQSIHIEAFV